MDNSKYSYDDFVNDKDRFLRKGGMLSFEIEYIDKDGEVDYVYGDIDFDHKQMTFDLQSGDALDEDVTIDIDYDFSLDENLEELYSEIINKIFEAGYDLPN